MAITYLRQLIKSSVVGGTIGLAISDRYVSVVPVQGNSMHPTFKECPPTFSGSLSGNSFCLLPLSLSLSLFPAFLVCLVEGLARSLSMRLE